MIKMEQLQYLVEISKYNSITLAAKKMYLTKAALSSAIKQLEKECGFAILERTYRGIIFTEKGNCVLKYAKQILNICNDIMNIAEEKDQLLSSEKKYDLYIDKHYINLLHRKLFSFNSIIFSLFQIREMDIKNDMDRLVKLTSDDCLIIIGTDDTQFEQIRQDDRIQIREIYSSYLYPVSSKKSKWISRKNSNLTAEEWDKCPKVILGNHPEEKNVVLTTENVELYRMAILNDIGIGTFAKFSDNIFVENRNFYRFYAPIDNTKHHLLIVSNPNCPKSIIDRLESILKS